MNETEFADKLKPWLERGATGIGEMQAVKLKSARLRAMDAYREPVRLFGLVPMSASRAQAIQYGIFQRALLFVPLLALLAVLAVRTLDTEMEPGDLDALLLTQELPPDAFIDQEFRSWLGKYRG